MAGDRVGRRSKGERHQQPVRFPVAHHQLYKELAARAGLDVSDFVAREMALRFGLPLPAHLVTSNAQEELPLPKAS